MDSMTKEATGRPFKIEAEKGTRRHYFTFTDDGSGALLPADVGERLAAYVAAHDSLVAALGKIVNNWGDLHPKDRQQARAALALAEGR